MTITQIEIDGETYPVIHYKFGVSQPGVQITQKNGVFYAKINSITYILGATKKDGDLDSIARAIEQKLTGEINE